MLHRCCYILCYRCNTMCCYAMDIYWPNDADNYQYDNKKKNDCI